MRIYNKLEVTVCLLSTLGMVVEGVLMSKRIGGISFGMTIGIFYLLHLLLFYFHSLDTPVSGPGAMHFWGGFHTSDKEVEKKVKPLCTLHSVGTK